MPLLANASSTPQPEPPAPPQPGFSLDRPLEQFEFTLSRGGESLRLPCIRTSTSPWLLGPGVDGLDMPEVSVEVDRSAGMWGGLSRDLDVPPREVFLPLTVEAGSLSALLEERDRFDRLVSPFTLEPVRLTVRRPNGVTRWVEGHVSGPSRSWSRGSWFAPSGRLSLGLALTCDDPWWHGEAVTESWGNTSSGGGTFFPIFPVRVTTDRILGGPTTVDVLGDVAGWPQWIVRGPATSVTIRHTESGRQWVANGTISASGSMTVDTSPWVAMTTGLQVRDGAGNDLWDRLQPPFDLWPLPPGEQTVTIEVVGATAATSVEFSLTPLYRSA